MPKQTYVVKLNETTELYMIGYNVGAPGESTFGNLEQAIEFNTLQEAQDVAVILEGAIGPGPLGLPRPR